MIKNVVKKFVLTAGVFLSLSLVSFSSDYGFATPSLAIPQGDSQQSQQSLFAGEWPIPLQVAQADLTELKGNWQVVGERLILTIEEERWEYLGLTVGNVRLTSLDKKRVIAQGFGFMIEGTLRGVIGKNAEDREYFTVGRGVHSLTHEQVFYLLRGKAAGKMEFYQLIP